MMRRFIDVIFIQPKQRYYVILHQGQFWQLTRLHLSHSSWLLKKPYDGALSDIYLAKSQAITCDKLATILQTTQLPPQLHGLDALRFLDWWNQYDYQWTANQQANPSATSVATANTANTATNHNPPAHNPATQQSPAQQSSWQANTTPKPNPTQTKAQANQPIAKQTQVAKTTDTQTATPTAQTQINQAQINQAQINQAQINQAQTATQTTTQTTTQTSTSDDELAIFDNLLHDLSEEVQRSHE